MIEAFRESKSSSLKKNSSRFHLKSCSVIVHVWEKLLLKIARCGGIVNPWGFITAVHLPMVSWHHRGLFKPPLKPLECHSDKIASGLCGGAHGCPIMPRDVRLSVKKVQKVAVRQAGSYQRLLAIYDVPSVGKNKPKWQGKKEQKSISNY